MSHPAFRKLALVAALATSLSATAADKSRSSVFDVADLDPAVSACADFDGFVNAKWITANPIPADRTRWGAFDKLADDSLNAQHEIVEKAARDAAKAAPGSIEQKIGWLYASGMNETAIDKAGFAPIKPTLAKIATLKKPAQIVDFINASYNEGDAYVFGFGSSPDFKDAKIQIGYASQHGLGLPTNEYYTDPKHKDELEAYRAHIVKTLQLVGTPAAEAKKQADAVIGFET